MRPLLGAALWVIAATLVVLGVRDVSTLERREGSGPDEQHVVESFASSAAITGSDPEGPL